MHFLRVHVHRPGATADQLLAALEESRNTTLLSHGPEFRALRASGADRDALLGELEDDLDRVAARLGVRRWTDHVRVS